MTGNIPYRNLIFIPVFFSFYILFKTFDLQDFVLESFRSRPISAATANGIDIGARVSQFYKAVFFLLFLLVSLTRITIIAEKYIPKEELRLLNGISLAGFSLLIFQLFGADIRPSIHIVLALFGVVGAGSVFHQVRQRTEKNYTVAFLWSAILAVCIFFLQWQLLRFTNAKNFLSLPVILLFFGGGLYLYSTNVVDLSFRIFKSTFPFVLIPFLSFAATELSMILNQREVFISPLPLYLSGLLVIVLTSLFAYKKNKGLHSGISQLEVFFNSWIPWLLAGMLCIAFYSPIVKAEADIFENANNILPLQQWFQFGKVPFLNSFNAHTLADLFPGIVYSFFNGQNPMGYFVYRFLIQVIVVLLVYFMMYKMTGDGFLALWFSFAFPYFNFLLPSYFSLVPLPVIALIGLYEKQTTGRYLFYLGSLVLLVLWRIDIGMSVLIAGLFSFLILAFFVPAYKVNRRALYRAGLLITSAMFVAFLFALFQSGSQLFVSISDILGYISSYQSYGIKDLAPHRDIQYYSLYFILPSAVLLIVITTIYLVRTGRISGKTVLMALVIVFLGIFYFSNFQRGLVRHTLFEYWNEALTSYGFFVIAAFIFMLIEKQTSESRFLIFFIVSTLLAANYAFPEPELKINNNYGSLAEKLYSSTVNLRVKEKLSRIEQVPANPHSKLKDWLDTKFPKGTFVDFSNSPMLYYYTNRLLPGYFVQSPHTAHNEYLQKRFIEDLGKHNVPIAVFSNVPLNFWDNLDGIPNTLRHYRISEYLYREYKPAFIVDGHSIWVKKSIGLPMEKELLTVQPDSLKTSSKFENGTCIITSDHGYLDYHFDSPISIEGKIYAIIKFSSKYSGDMIVRYKTATGRFDEEHKSISKYLSGDNKLFLMFDNLNTGEQLSDFSIELPRQAEITFSSIKLFEGESYADHFSTQPLASSLKLIPFVWGTYDENYRLGKIEMEKNIISSTLKLTDQPMRMDFEPIKNKENGNYLRLSLRAESANEAEVTVKYGAMEQTNGTFSFTVKNDSVFHDYLLRISSQYGWYNNENTWLTVSSASEKVEMKSADILKGD